MGITNRKHLIMKDLAPKFDKGNSNFLVKVFVWGPGGMYVIEKVFDNRKEADNYVDSLEYEDANVKVYNEHSILIRSEHCKGKHKGWETYA